jgi:hypothetical protein
MASEHHSMQKLHKFSHHWRSSFSANRIRFRVAHDIDADVDWWLFLLGIALDI